MSDKQLEGRAQFLDSIAIERERGVTIKARAARMPWREHCISIIDCPGHHDFSRQVLQSVEAAEGALLLVDASQGVQAQTISSVELALEAGLEILPVINKIDLPTADVDASRYQIEQLIGLDASDAILTSAKKGVGIEDVLNGIIARLPAPTGDKSAPLQALVFDSYFDQYRGVVVFIRVMHGIVRKGDRIRPMSVQTVGGQDQGVREFLVDSVGFLSPDEVATDALRAGDIGFFTASIKSTGDVPAGDTITTVVGGAESALKRYEDPKPVVFCGLFPGDSGDVTALRNALQKLQLQDSSLVFEPDKSAAMGTGYRCGFLGLLAMSVTIERLETEFNLNLIASSPSVSYNVRYPVLSLVLQFFSHSHSELSFSNCYNHVVICLLQVLEEGSDVWRLISNPAAIPHSAAKIQEPYARVDLICSDDHVGGIMELAQSRRGELRDQRYIGLNRMKLVYSIPLSELVTDFHDAVKSRSKGYASMDYEIDEMRENPLQRMDIVIAGSAVDGMSCIVHRDNAYSQGRWLVGRLKEVIPRQMFKVAIQAVVGTKTVASEQINAFRKGRVVIASTSSFLWHEFIHSLTVLSNGIGSLWSLHSSPNCRW